MARFDVHRNRNVASHFPLLLDVQADFLADLHTRIVVPLAPLAAAGSLRRGLNPEVAIEGETYVLQTEILGAVHVSQLGETVASLQDRHHTIVAAIDFLMQGF